MASKLFGYVVLLFVLPHLWSLNIDFQSDTGVRCDKSLWAREPTKKPDVGFRVRMETNLILYAPEKKYVVYLEAAMNNSKFIKFVLTVDSLNNTDPGSFELNNNILTEFSRECPNTIQQTSFIPKTAITVLWKAPVVDSGCVLIRGAVYDIGDSLHHGGNLSLKLCQGELDETVLPEILDNCGACNEASYQLMFEGLWSRQTHPKQFPQNAFETSFDGIIGVSHANEFRLWEFKKNASDGIAEVAETGKTKLLESELKAQSELIRTVIKAKGLSHPNLNNKTYAIFRADDKNHLLSIIAKFSPSPDWVVGLSALELCLSNNSWATSRVINLYPIDVGTIEGVSYKSPKVPTIPRAAIRQISPSENWDSPFYSETGVIQPLAKVTVHRQRVFWKTKCITSDFYFNNHECAVTDWFNDGPCDCRLWSQRRKRTYKNPSDKYNSHCRLSLVEDIPCSCEQSTTFGNGLPNYRPFTNVFTTDNPMSCDTTVWSSWSECTCRNPYRSRRRFYKNSAAGQGCTELLWEKQDCIDMPTCDPVTNAMCAVTEWSEWSPCNATCEMTMGMRLRTRLFFTPTINVSSCNIHTIESEPCRSERTNCNGTPKEICFEPKQEGPCTGYFVRWYYNVHERRCVQFIFGGCRGNRNNFKSFSECHRVCNNVFTESLYNIPKEFTPIDPNQVIDCKLGQWGEWSPCSSTCGVSWKDRRRTVEVNAMNGGQQCDKKTYQRKKCKDLPSCSPTTSNYVFKKRKHKRHKKRHPVKHRIARKRRNQTENGPKEEELSTQTNLPVTDSNSLVSRDKNEEESDNPHPYWIMLTRKQMREHILLNCKPRIRESVVKSLTMNEGNLDHIKSFNDGDVSLCTYNNSTKNFNGNSDIISRYQGKQVTVEKTTKKFYPLRSSLFYNVPPYLSFGTNIKKMMKLPKKIRAVLQWKLSTVTPSLIVHIVKSSGFKITKDESSWLSTWGRHVKSQKFTDYKENQKVNHFPGSFLLGRKDRLWLNILKMQNLHGNEAFNIMPETFIFPREIEKLQTIWFEGEYETKWIIKPPASGGGVGVIVVHRWEDVPKTRLIIVQRYISRPYLINDTKFDLRLYILVTSFDPLRIYVFEDGLVRFASEKYTSSEESLRKRFVHLTNYRINRSNSGYKANHNENLPQGHKWTLKCLWSYFRESGIDDRVVWNSLLDVIIKTLISCEDLMSRRAKKYSRNRYSCYELYGFDILLDHSLKPWLLEVNTCPSLHTRTDLDWKVKSELIKDMFTTVGFHVPEYTNLSPRKHFQVLKRAKVHPENEICWNKYLYDFNVSREGKLKQAKFEQGELDESSLIENLTPDDIRLLIHSEDELARCGSFIRVFPSKTTFSYLEYFQCRKYYNYLLNAWEKEYCDKRQLGIASLQTFCKKKIHLQTPHTICDIYNNEKTKQKFNIFNCLVLSTKPEIPQLI